jgi:hypothetical protein
MVCNVFISFSCLIRRSGQKIQKVERTEYKGRTFLGAFADDVAPLLQISRFHEPNPFRPEEWKPVFGPSPTGFITNKQTNKQTFVKKYKQNDNTKQADLIVLSCELGSQVGEVGLNKKQRPDRND